MAAAILLNMGSSENPVAPSITVADLVAGQKGIVLGVSKGDETLKRRLTAFGILRGTEISLDRTSPWGNPRAYSLLGYQLSLRNEDARSILIRIS